MHFTKNQILNRLNKTNEMVVLEPTGPVRSESAKMPILLVLKAIVESQGLKPGEDCEITDYKVSQDAVTVEYQSGSFKKDSIVPSRLTDLLVGDSAPTRDADFE